MDNTKEQTLEEKYPLKSSEAFPLLDKKILETEGQDGIVYRIYCGKDKRIHAKMRNYKGKWFYTRAIDFFITTGFRWRVLTKAEEKDFLYEIR